MAVQRVVEFYRFTIGLAQHLARFGVSNEQHVGLPGKFSSLHSLHLFAGFIYYHNRSACCDVEARFDRTAVPQWYARSRIGTHKTLFADADNVSPPPERVP